MMDAIKRAADAIAHADGMMILAGAGMGVDSGLPDFRGKEGFWKAYPVLKQKRLSFADIANPDAFRTRPTLAWGFYGHRLHLYRETLPHAGFRHLLDMSSKMALGAFVYTSNVDGQFQKAGFDADRILECHGSIHHLQHLEPESWEEPFSADSYNIEVDSETLRASYESMPRAVNGDLLRPNILMFNDWYWSDKRTIAQSEHFNAWLSQASGKRLVIVEIGAGNSIATIRHQAGRLKRQTGATLIQINPNPDKYADITLKDGALSALSQIHSLL